MQKILNANQVAAFYHDAFVRDQVSAFKKMGCSNLNDGVIVDVGGGCGYFASAVSKELNISTRVIDSDSISVGIANEFGVQATIGNALYPTINKNDRVACFNLILHHLVGASEEETLKLQSQAITAWQNSNVKIFVNEYIYESWIGNMSGWLIYQITRSNFLSYIGKLVSIIIPSLKANTFGVGVRFRSNEEWKIIFRQAGFLLIDEVKGEKEFISMARRLLLIKEIRRDSFLLVPEK